MKKHLAMTMVLMMLLGALAGCGGAASQGADAAASGADSAGASAGGAAGASAASNPPAPAGAADSRIPLSIGTGASTGTSYFVGAALAEVFNKYSEKYVLSAEATGGTSENIGLLGQGAIELGICASPDVADAYNGIYGYEGKKTPNLRMAMGGHTHYMHFMALRGSDVKTFSDFQGKKIAYAPSAWQMRKALLAGWGFEENRDYTAQYAPHADNAESLKDGLIVAWGFDAGIPNSTVSDLATTNGVQFIPLLPDEFERIHEMFPYYEYGAIPGGTYPGVSEDSPCLIFPTTISTQADAPEDFVYELVKIITSHTDEFGAIHPSGYEYTPEAVVKGYDLEMLHPGARRYYEEMGWL
ncbi:MAG: TAXI family TRAP transporter solute-binding subunit [Peptococcaceae bacterium]|jgi:TRAP transporter TAXI family solute receptor|nr:TAXI family TRAP transporter solute-binding subunit [Peptococcaceae bacterium]